MPNSTWTEGWLPDGTHFHVDEDPYAGDGVLRMNGEILEPLPGRLSVSRLRDGGTTYIKTPTGTFTAWRRMGAEHYDAWNGERLLTSDPNAQSQEHHVCTCGDCSKGWEDRCRFERQLGDLVAAVQSYLDIERSPTELADILERRSVLESALAEAGADV